MPSDELPLQLQLQDFVLFVLLLKQPHLSNAQHQQRLTMILAILIIAYKKINNIKGFKIAKLKFELELENEIIKTIVMLCGGNPNKAAHLFNSS